MYIFLFVCVYVCMYLRLYLCTCVYISLMVDASSVASFLVLGAGGGWQDPEMYRQKIYVLILRERAKRASA